MAITNCRKFRKVIFIQERIKSKTKNGIPIDIWVTKSKTYADVWNIHGSELLSNLDQFTNKTYKRMQIRYKRYLDVSLHDDVTHNYRIIYRNSIWNLTSIDDIKDTHKTMEILITKIENSNVSLEDEDKGYKDSLKYYISTDQLSNIEIQKFITLGFITQEEVDTWRGDV